MRPTTVSLAVLALLSACGGGDPVTGQPAVTAPVQGYAQPLLPIDLQPMSAAPSNQ